MPTTLSDQDLLVEYASTHSPSALGQLIEHHIDFVYSIASCQLRDASLAEDVTQAVFIILAKKARSIHPSSLAGWLFNTTRLCAKNARRAQSRRNHHERLAAKKEASMPPDQPADGLHRMLDDGIATLSRLDRQVVLLRYLQAREFTELSALLGISESAARKRLHRAIIRLRQYFTHQGTTLTPAAIIATLATARQHAPAHLLHAATLAATGNTVGTTLVSPIAAKTIQLAAWMKIKIALGIVLATLAAGSVAPVFHRVMSQSPIPAQTPASSDFSTVASPTTRPAQMAASFSDGIKVEFLGLSENPSKDKPWWRPDGSPLEKPPYPYTQFTGTAVGIGMRSYESAIRITGAPKGFASTYRGGGSYWQLPDPAGNPNSILLCRAFATLPGSPTTLRLQLATQPQQLRATATTDALRNGPVAGNGVIFNPPTDSTFGLVLVVTDKYVDESYTLTAIDLNGNAHMAGTNTDGGFLTQNTTATFHGLQLARAKEFRFRSRPYDRWVEFKNVSLTPGQITNVEIQTNTPPPSK
jgi:RNA polymerase sigma factor (sigma-70 family)